MLKIGGKQTYGEGVWSKEVWRGTFRDKGKDIIIAKERGERKGTHIYWVLLDFLYPHLFHLLMINMDKLTVKLLELLQHSIWPHYYTCLCDAKGKDLQKLSNGSPLFLPNFGSHSHLYAFPPLTETCFSQCLLREEVDSAEWWGSVVENRM